MYSYCTNIRTEPEECVVSRNEDVTVIIVRRNIKKYDHGTAGFMWEYIETGFSFPHELADEILEKYKDDMDGLFMEIDIYRTNHTSEYLTQHN